MSLRAVFSLLVVLGFAGTAAAQTYYLGATGLGRKSGVQFQIGGGLPLPIQLTDANFDLAPDWGATGSTTPMTGGLFGPGASVFPPLLIPPKSPLVTVMGTPMLGVGQKLTIKAGVFALPPVQKTLGVFAQNKVLYAVGLDLGAKWPFATATFKQRLATPKIGGTPTPFFVGPPGVVWSMVFGTRKIRHQNPGMSTIMKAPFGGFAPGMLTPVKLGGPPEIKTTVAVTVYGLAGALKVPPCVMCTAAILAASPAVTGAIGGKASNKILTPGPKVAGKNVYLVTATLGPPLGTLMGPRVPLAASPMVPGNMATSTGAFWTTGLVDVSAPGAAGTPEHFWLQGSDMRNNAGGGPISLVSGSVSLRTTSKANANRGWVRLVLVPTDKVPSISDWGMVALTGSLLAMGVFAALRKGRSGAAVGA